MTVGPISRMPHNHLLSHLVFSLLHHLSDVALYLPHHFFSMSKDSEQSSNSSHPHPSQRAMRLKKKIQLRGAHHLCSMSTFSLKSRVVAQPRCFRETPAARRAAEPAGSPGSCSGGGNYMQGWSLFDTHELLPELAKLKGLHKHLRKHGIAGPARDLKTLKQVLEALHLKGFLRPSSSGDASCAHAIAYRRHAHGPAHRVTPPSPSQQQALPPTRRPTMFRSSLGMGTTATTA